MSIAYLDYELENGYVQNWLVAGPQAIRVADLDRYTGADFKLQIARHYHAAASGVAESPAEATALTIDDFKADWEYTRCGDDHLVDLTVFHHICHYLRAWAYTQLVAASAQAVTLVLTTNGPADVWLNGEHVHRQEHFSHQKPRSVSFPATLRAGPNELLVRFEEVAARECPYAMALHVTAANGVSVRVPTAIENVGERQALERALYAAHLRRDVFKYDDQVQIFWPNDFEGSYTLTIRVQSPAGNIYSEGNKDAKAGAVAEMGQAYQFPDGEYELLMMPKPQDYYYGHQRLTRKLRCWIIRNQFSLAPYEETTARRYEGALAATRREGSLYGEIARMTLDAWDMIDRPLILKVIDGINSRADCSDFQLVGLLGMALRFGDNPSFPTELLAPLKQCALGFRYWHDEPGSDAMWFLSENHSILFHACEILAGQLYPDDLFTNTGETGQAHRAKGEQRALAWLRDRALNGFKEWDSNCYFEEDVLALTHLASLAENEDVAEIATVILDKLFFLLALNSFHGIFGSTHGRTYNPFIKSGYNEATSPLSRILWGMGVWNGALMGTVSLAGSDYVLPPVIAAIAADQPAEMWSRERHTGSREDFFNSGNSWPDINKVTYKTPDYMLCSAQDYYPGEQGCQQHIWQATFGPDALVFVNHPACASEEGSHRPGFWHGNATLPRVAQYKDVLVAVHKMADDDWMDFTHAFFPAFAFDVFEQSGNWAFGKSGEGYIALTAANGLNWMTSGANAYRELRSPGRHNVWICQMGRAAIDGDFESFKKRVLALPVAFDDLNVRFSSLRGDEVAFGWQGDFKLNGQPQPLSGFKHYESPYCVSEMGAPQMEIIHGEQGVRLKFQ